MVSAVTLAIGLLATGAGVVFIAALLYYALVSLRSDRHSPETVRD